jgi:dihydropteroate synthase
MWHNPRVLEPHTAEQLRAALLQVGAEPSALDEEIARGTFRIVKLENVSLPLARFLYQELVMEGGQVVTAARLEHVGAGETDVLLCATRYHFEHLSVRLRWQEDEELQLLARDLETTLENYEHASSRTPTRALTLGGTRLEWGTRTYVMGILNLTPDSFSGDALIQPNDNAEQYTARALQRAREMIDAGADLLDIGGESTHPRATPIDAETELARVLPMVQALAREANVPLSVDTSKPEVARAALDAGAQLVNDVSGLREREMARVAAARGAALVVMHNWLGRIQPTPDDFIGAIMKELRAQIEMALDTGIAPERIVIDPGIGFGKSLAQNLELIDRLGELRSLGFPILIGVSRKGFISRAIDVPKEQREAGTAAAMALGIARGADMVRVHDVRAMARVAKMTDHIVRGSGREGATG